MKKTLVILILCATSALFAQTTEEETPKDKDRVTLDFGTKVFIFKPMQYGNHALSEAHEIDLGFGVNMKILSYGDFHFNIGYDVAKYTVTDYQIMGNFENSHYSSLYGTISYELPIGKKFRFSPDAGFGYAVINQRSNASSFGHQDGTELRIGFSGNYYFARNWSVFVGAHFIHNRFEIATHPDYQDFFGQANQIQLSFGVQLD